MDAGRDVSHPLVEHTDSYELVAGTKPGRDDHPVSIGRTALEGGLYIAGPKPERRTELLTQQLIQLAGRPGVRWPRAVHLVQ